MSSATPQTSSASAAPAAPSVSSVTPSDSVSNTSKKQKKGGRKNGPSKDASITTGSIPVPSPSSRASSQSSPIASAAIPITGWGLSDIQPMTKSKPLLEFEPDAIGFFGLVDAVYRDASAVNPTVYKHVPASLFRYYCGLAWWYRTLHVHKSNGFPLWTEAKRFLDSYSGLDELKLPDKIAQYLANLGNYDYNGEHYRMRVPELDLSGSRNRKQFGTLPGKLSGEMNASSFWRYAQFPIPCSLLCNIANEAKLARNSTLWISPHLFEKEGYQFHATENIVGFSRGLPAAHSSWTSTFGTLGWDSSVPRDLQTQFCFSPSTVKWVSDKLGTSSLKMHPFKQIALTRQGNFAQIGWLNCPDYLQSRYTNETDVPGDINRFSAASQSCFRISARSALPGSVLSALFCFGYQADRYATPDGKRSIFDPWFVTKDGQLSDYFAEWQTLRNRSLDALDTDLKVPRYHTYDHVRDVVLTSALMPS